MIDRTACVAVVAALGGCTIRGEYRPAAYVGNGALIVAGGVLLHKQTDVCDHPDYYPCSPSGNEIPTTKVIGASLLAIGAIGLAMQIAGDVQPETVAPDPPIAHASDDTNTDDVRILTDDARDDARAGACIDVQSIARRVAVLDPPYFRSVFKVDRDIASCL